MLVLLKEKRKNGSSTQLWTLSKASYCVFVGKRFIIKAIARLTWETDGLRSRIVWTCYGTTHGRRQAGEFVI